MKFYGDRWSVSFCSAPAHGAMPARIQITTLRCSGITWKVTSPIAGVSWIGWPTCVAPSSPTPEAFIDAKPYPAGAYRKPTALMGEIRREGVDL